MQSFKFLGAASALVLAFGFASNKAEAAGAPAGTVINNTADVSYTVGTVNTTASSNLVSVTVAEIIDVNVTRQTPANVTVSPGDTALVSTYRIDNTGNGSEVFRILLDNAVTSNQFNPTAATPAIYIDSGSAGTPGAFDSTDIVYVPGSNDPSLARDTNVIVHVVNDIPGTALDGQLGISRLSAESRTGTGPAGTTFAGQGNGISGAVDAVIGTSTGTDAEDTTYLIAGVTVSAVKTQTVVDNFGGGSRPVPGSRINYSIAVTATGSGTATNVVFIDNIPANTTYVAGSLALNAVAVTDAAGLPDDGDYSASPTPRVRVPLGSLNAAAGTKTITFSVTIN